MSKAPTTVSSADPFDAIRRRLASGKGGSSAIAAELAEVAALKDRFQGEHAALSQSRSASLLTADPAALAASRAAFDALADQLDVCAAFRTKLVADHAAALAAEENARRAAAYEIAAEKVERAATFGKRYAAAARAMAEAVTLLFEGKVAAAQANAALPDGAAALGDPELAFVRIPGAAKEIVSEKATKLWCLAGSWDPACVNGKEIAEDDDRVVRRGDKSSNAGTINGLRVELKTFLRRKILPAVYDVYGERVALKLSIPGYILPPIVGWEGAFDSASYLAGIAAALAAQDAAPPAPTRRQPQTELIPIDSDGVVLEHAGAVAKAIAA